MVFEIESLTLLTTITKILHYFKVEEYICNVTTIFQMFPKRSIMFPKHTKHVIFAPHLHGIPISEPYSMRHLFKKHPRAEVDSYLVLFNITHDLIVNFPRKFMNIVEFIPCTIILVEALLSHLTTHVIYKLQYCTIFMLYL